MRWGYFIKGSVFSLFLLFFSLTAASLFFNIKTADTVNKTQEVAIDVSKNEVAVVPKQFPQVLAAKTQNTPAPKPVNILLLGLDSRIGDRSARCDAIHMFSFKPDEGKIIITSVPRGTMVTADQYISNYCSIYGFDVAQKEIERITGVKADHVVKVGFSQVQGLLRIVGLPAAPTLQLLRDRKDYVIGDNQRSYNQAVFFKDSIIRYADWADKLPWPIQEVGFKMLTTDLGFDEAKKIFEDVLASGIYKDPNNIEIRIRPWDGLTRQDVHVQTMVPTNNDWQNDPEFKAYQNDVAGYLNAVVARTNYLIDKKQYEQANGNLTLPLSQKLWLQIENQADRNGLHYEIVEAFVYSSTDYDKSKSLLNDFILEMGTEKETDLKTKAEELLKLL